MLICGKILIVYYVLGFYSTIKVLKFINKNFKTWPQPLCLKMVLQSPGGSKAGGPRCRRHTVAECETRRPWRAGGAPSFDRCRCTISWQCPPNALSIPPTALPRSSSNEEGRRWETRQPPPLSGRKGSPLGGVARLSPYYRSYPTTEDDS